MFWYIIDAVNSHKHIYQVAFALISKLRDNRLVMFVKHFFQDTFDGFADMVIFIIAGILGKIDHKKPNDCFFSQF